MDVLHLPAPVRPSGGALVLQSLPQCTRRSTSCRPSRTGVEYGASLQVRTSGAGGMGVDREGVSRQRQQDQATRRQLLLAGLVAASSAVGGAANALTYDRPMEAYDEMRLLEQNRRIQQLNQAPDNFPGFIRQGFEVKVVSGPEYLVSPTGLIYWDIVPGEGETPTSGQEVVFHYIGFNESGRRVDSTYLQGRPARTRVGINGMIPGFEEGINGMRAGGRRRIVIPPELGPPTGPATFFSSKQYEVFDIELLTVRSCERRQIVFYSDVVCT